VIEGIVPDAYLFCTSSNYGDWRERAEWLLDQYVNVINISAGWPYATGTYTDGDKWWDHIAINHSVHVVVASGNNGGIYGERTKKISSPGMAYNVITVGSINDFNTVSVLDDVLSDFSSTEEGDDGGAVLDRTEDDGIAYHNKPDLVAPGSNIDTGACNYPGFGQYDNDGTSFAAPHATGTIAQLLQARTTLKPQQDAVKAILTASIRHSKLVYDSNNPEHDKYGAGVVDSSSANWTAMNGRYTSSYFNANSSNGAIQNFYVSTTASDTEIRVSLTWLKYNKFLTTDHDAGGLLTTDITNNLLQGRLADLDVEIFDPNGNLVEGSYSGYNNFEMVQFDPTITGQYRIQVKQFSNSDQKVYFGLAWW
jgi:subtilisin family serine protease